MTIVLIITELSVAFHLIYKNPQIIPSFRSHLYDILYLLTEASVEHPDLALLSKADLDYS